MTDSKQQTFGKTEIEYYDGWHTCDQNMIQYNGEKKPCTHQASIVIRSSSRSYYYCKVHARNQWLADAQ